MDSLYGKHNGVDEITHQHIQKIGQQWKIKNWPKGRHGFLLVYAPWCGFCHDPSFIQSNITYQQQVAPRLHSHLVAMNSEFPGNSSILQQLNIDGFPTFLHVDPKGRLHPYQGGRSLVNRGLFIFDQSSSSL